jgi:hypothetical protein
MDGVVEITADLPILSNNTNTVNIRYLNTRRHMYMMLHYDDELLCYDDSHNGIYRSVVLAYPDPRVLSFAPPKTVPFSHFKLLSPTWSNNICTNEYIKGTMIQLFYDFRIDDWEISTENYIGGYERVMSNANAKTNLRSLFIATLGGMHHENMSDLPFLEYMPKEMSYTFILQASSAVKLYLVSVYQINTDSKNQISYVSNRIYENWPEFANIQGLFHFPQTVSVQDYAELENIMCKTANRNVVITNTQTGVRSILTTREYRRVEAVKRLPELNLYQFLCLHRTDKLHGYLRYFPKHRKQLMAAKEAHRLFIDQLHELYVSQYIRKTVDSVPAPYSCILRRLHKQIYLPSLKTRTKATVNKYAIQLFLNELDPREVLHLMKLS